MVVICVISWEVVDIPKVLSKLWKVKLVCGILQYLQFQHHSVVAVSTVNNMDPWWCCCCVAG